jgi:hypothetical protein
LQLLCNLIFLSFLKIFHTVVLIKKLKKQQLTKFDSFRFKLQNSFIVLATSEMSATDEDDLFTGRITPGFVNLAVGAPGPETLKKSAELFDSAAKHRLAKVSAGDVSLFQYGLPCGNREYLRLLANFLSDEYGDQVQFKRLFT